MKLKCISKILFQTVFLNYDPCRTLTLCINFNNPLKYHRKGFHFSWALSFVIDPQKHVGSIVISCWFVEKHSLALWDPFINRHHKLFNVLILHFLVKCPIGMTSPSRRHIVILEGVCGPIVPQRKELTTLKIKLKPWRTPRLLRHIWSCYQTSACSRTFQRHCRHRQCGLRSNRGYIYLIASR